MWGLSIILGVALVWYFNKGGRQQLSSPSTPIPSSTYQQTNSYQPSFEGSGSVDKIGVNNHARHTDCQIRKDWLTDNGYTECPTCHEKWFNHKN